jgi:arginase
LNNFTNKAESVYLHIDMDVLDTGEALPNHFAVPGGLPVEMVVQIIAAVKEKFEVAAAAITSFDPDYDKDDQVLEAGIKIIQAFVS